MPTVSIYEAKTHFSQLVDQAEARQEIIVTRHGRPVARIASLRRTDEARRPGALRGQIKISPDFDTLPEDELERWYTASGSWPTPVSCSGGWPTRKS
ncbi:MAG: type II toxin-antitoxin system Phd/YefM family antitoxin [Bifidobacteriaceae bacterium]|jgi:prevent-host-death family protein|nr:type II toxin-antitoxin system Phd/YefM family antitoxin [Bifidobacteriaceae bacterium]